MKINEINLRKILDSQDETSLEVELSFLLTRCIIS